MRRVVALLIVFVALLPAACDSKSHGRNDNAIDPPTSRINQRTTSYSTPQPTLQVAASRPTPQGYAPQPTPRVTASRPTPQVKQEVEQRYWITIKSGVRHNSSCRYYHNSNGRPCGPNEGRPCKICGG
jgi:hypothetical protein